MTWLRRQASRLIELRRSLFTHCKGLQGQVRCSMENRLRQRLHTGDSLLECHHHDSNLSNKTQVNNNRSTRRMASATINSMPAASIKQTNQVEMVFTALHRQVSSISSNNRLQFSHHSFRGRYLAASTQADTTSRSIQEAMAVARTSPSTRMPRHLSIVICNRVLHVNNSTSNT